MEKENEILEKQGINVEEKKSLKEENEIVEEIKVEEKQENNIEADAKHEKTTNEEEKQEEIKEKEQEESKEDIKEESKKSNKKLLILLLIIVIILLFLSTIFAIINMNNTNIIDGIFIEQIPIYNMTQEEANNNVNKKISNITEVSVNYSEYSENIKIEDLGIEIDAKEAMEKAMYLGKTSNILVDNYQILKAMLFEEHFDLNINIDDKKFDKVVKNIQAELPEALVEYSYEIKNDKLIITNGKSGNSINKNELKNKIIENIKEQFNQNNNNVQIPVEFKNPEKIDIEKIYKEIYKEAKDAYIVEEPFELHKEENGVDLGITIEEAKQILAKDKENYTIPLKISKPKVSVKELGDKLFKQTLSKYTTLYDPGNYNRGHNVALAAKTINGTILLPGETFSYNRTLGNTNAAKGYKQASAYAGGKVIQSYGGGICQVSSTLYNAVLYANLEIVERYNHSYAVSYVPAGRDATVAYGGKDFKFKNSRTYPIKIVANAKNGVVSISIAGIKEKVEYDVELTSSVLSTTACQTTYENNSELEEGTQKVIQKGYTGKKSIAYKVLKLNGKTISKTVLSKDTYKPMNRIIQIGTKKVTVPVTTPSTTIQTDTTTIQTPTVPDTTTATNTIG